MIDVEELKKIGKLKGIANIGHIEKDYLSDLILLSISRHTKEELIFKGGTCLFKFYKLDRFSEDLDFTLKKELDITRLLNRIVSDLKVFGIECEIKKMKQTHNAIMITLRIKGPFYTGDDKTIATMRIDINTKSTIELKPLVQRYISLYPDIPIFSIIIMQEKEILSEKIRAILTRTKARDIYDLWFLLKKGVEFDPNLVKKKLKYYNMQWNKNLFLKNLNIKSEIWKAELKPLVRTLPEFSEVKKLIREKIKISESENLPKNLRKREK